LTEVSVPHQTSIHPTKSAARPGATVSDHETTTSKEAPESSEERRTRQSAREVAEWEADLAAGKVDGGPAQAADADRANAGAMVSRAHRAEKTNARPPQP
jgi:hypothetical protein